MTSSRTSVAPLWATPRNPHRATFGPQVGKLATALGTPLMPWQTRVADTALEIDAAGHYVYGTVIVTVPRQSGKTTLLRPVYMHRCLTTKRASTWLTAQTRNDARDLWEQTVEVVEDSALSPLISVRRTNGGEHLMINATRGRFRVFAPGERALHGKTTHVVGVDEAWAFSLEQGTALDQAIVPTQLTIPGAQTWIVSTAGTAKSQWFREMVTTQRALLEAGTPSPTIAFFEWAVPPDSQTPSDFDTIARHHPALGHTITVESLRTAVERITSAGERARAFGNYWVSSDEYVIAPALWEGARTFDPIVGRVAFAAETSADRSHSVIVGAGTLADGRTAVEMIDCRDGSAWLAPRLVELVRQHRPTAVVIDPYGPARATYATLAKERRTRVPLHVDYSAGDYVMSCGALQDGLVDGTLAHRSHKRLDTAVSALTARTVREQEAFSRTVVEEGERKGDSPAAIIAAALALFGHLHPPDLGAPPAVGGGGAGAAGTGTAPG